MAPDSLAAVLLPVLRLRLLPVLQCRRRRGWSTSGTRAGGAARGRRERRTTPSRGRAEAPREGGVRLRCGAGGDKATPKGRVL